MLGVKDLGRAPMAWRIRPGFRGDLKLVRRRQKPPQGVRTRTNQVRTCNAVRRIVCCVQCSLPCVIMRGRGTRQPSVMATRLLLLLPETMLAKEAKTMGTFCRGNHLGCRNRTDRGLQYGLSGNRVDMLVTHIGTDQMETAYAVTWGSVRGNPTRPKP